MAARFGKDGYIAFDSSSGIGTTSSSGSFGTTQSYIPTYIDTWQLNAKQNLAEVTAFGNKWKNYYPTVREWTVTASGNLDKGSTAYQETVLLGMLDNSSSYNSGAYPMRTVYLRLYESTCYWQGKAKINEIKVASQVAGNIAVTYTLQGTSSITYTTS